MVDPSFFSLKFFLGTEGSPLSPKGSEELQTSFGDEKKRSVSPLSKLVSSGSGAAAFFLSLIGRIAFWAENFFSSREEGETLVQSLRADFDAWRKSWAPDPAQIEKIGEGHLIKWGTSSSAQEALFRSRFPKIDWMAAPSGPLSGAEARSLYREWIETGAALIEEAGKRNPFQSPLQRAKAAFEFRKAAKEKIRLAMSDQREVSALALRDRAVYGTDDMSFAYMVGKYGKQAASELGDDPERVERRTAELIEKGARKTNFFFNAVSRFF